MIIFLTDANQRAALAITRSLGKAGHKVIVGDTSINNLSAASKYCYKSIEYPSPYVDDIGFIRKIEEIIYEENVDVVMPVSDISSILLSQNKPIFSNKTIICTCDYEKLSKAVNKNYLHRIADKLSIPTPTIIYIDNPDNFSRHNLSEYPYIIKPAFSRIKIGENWLATTVKKIDTPEKFRESIISKNISYPYMIQKRIIGDGCAIFALCRQGEIEVAFAHKRILEKPPTGGVSVLRESIPTDPIMLEYARKLLREINWDGVAMVEFKKEKATDIPYLMEINARFWGSLQLAIDSGIDFPVMQLNLYTGKPVTYDDKYHVGVRSRWFLGEIDHIIARIRMKKGEDQGLPKLWDVIKDVVSIGGKNTYFEIEKISDSGPWRYEWMSYLRNIVKALFTFPK